jgi:hypothetical protein
VGVGFVEWQVDFELVFIKQVFRGSFVDDDAAIPADFVGFEFLEDGSGVGECLSGGSWKWPVR